MSVSIASIPCGEPECDREFGSEAARVSHRRHIHGIGMVDPLSFPCRVDTCSASFGTEANRNEHMRIEHAPGRTAGKDGRGAGPSSGNGVAAERASEPRRPAPAPQSFVCDQIGCDASFDTNSKLGTHRWSKHRIRAAKVAPKRPPSIVDRLLADEDELVTIELRESLAKRLLDIVLSHGDGVDLDFTDPASLRREADRIELEQAVKSAIE